MFENLISAEPTEPPSLPCERFYGLMPAMPSRFGLGRPGLLVEVDEAGRETDRWNVQRNEDAVAFLVGKPVAIPPDHPSLLAELEAAGARVFEVSLADAASLAGAIVSTGDVIILR